MLYEPGKAIRNLHIALTDGWRYGMILKFVEDWEWYFQMYPQPGKVDERALQPYRLTRTRAEQMAKELEAELIEEMRKAFVSKNGSFFRQVADCLEEKDQLADKNRVWLSALCFDWITGAQKNFYTYQQLVEMANKRIGWNVSTRRMATICKQLGIKVRKAKRGRPRKTRNRWK